MTRTTYAHIVRTVRWIYRLSLKGRRDKKIACISRHVPGRAVRSSQGRFAHHAPRKANQSREIKSLTTYMNCSARCLVTILHFVTHRRMQALHLQNFNRHVLTIPFLNFLRVEFPMSHEEKRSVELT